MKHINNQKNQDKSEQANILATKDTQINNLTLQNKELINQLNIQTKQFDDQLNIQTKQFDGQIKKLTEELVKLQADMVVKDNEKLLMEVKLLTEHKNDMKTTAANAVNNYGNNYNKLYKY